MLTIERTSVMNFENAIRGARNPMNSWARSDSGYDGTGNFVFGPNDLDLARRLCASGSDHRKFIRQIFVSVDITAPLYWWKEYDTYKVGTVANSTSTMHRIHSKPFELADFSTDHMTPATLEQMERLIAYLESVRQTFNATKDKSAWYDLIQLCPPVTTRCAPVRSATKILSPCIMRAGITNWRSGIPSAAGSRPCPTRGTSSW